MILELTLKEKLIEDNVIETNLLNTYKTQASTSTKPNIVYKMEAGLRTIYFIPNAFYLTVYVYFELPTLHTSTYVTQLPNIFHSHEALGGTNV